MSGLRTPVVVGLHPRAGTSTVAAVLHAHEGSGAAADIVCVGEPALPSALALTTHPSHLRPVLAVAAAPPAVHTPLPTRGVRVEGGCEGLLELESRFSAVVVVPHLARWAGCPGPSEEIALLLGLENDRLPLPLQAYAAALRDIAAAVVRSGRLAHGAAPVLLRQRADLPRRPVAHPIPSAQPGPVTPTNPTAHPALSAQPGPAKHPVLPSRAAQPATPAAATPSGTAVRTVAASRALPTPLPRPVSRPDPPAPPVGGATIAPPIRSVGPATVASSIPIAIRRPASSPAPVRLQVLAVRPVAAVRPVPGASVVAARLAHPPHLDPASRPEPGTDPLDDDALEAAGLAATGRVG